MEGRKPKSLSVCTDLEATQYELSYSTEGYWDWESACKCCRFIVATDTMAYANDVGLVCKECAEDLGYSRKEGKGRAMHRWWVA